MRFLYALKRNLALCFPYLVAYRSKKTFPCFLLFPPNPHKKFQTPLVFTTFKDFLLEVDRDQFRCDTEVEGHSRSSAKFGLCIGDNVCGQVCEKRH